MGKNVTGRRGGVKYSTSSPITTPLIPMHCKPVDFFENVDVSKDFILCNKDNIGPW